MQVFQLKPKIYFGCNSLDALEKLKPMHVMVITDHYLAGSGLLALVENRLGEHISVFEEVCADPPLEVVARGIHQLEQKNPGAIVAFGGGSVMDCAKAVRFYSHNHDLPLWAVPTTAGTGAEVTSFAVLTDTEKGIKYPLVDDALLPDAAILDASLLSELPGPVAADTGMDVLTHALEAYVSRRANLFSDALAEYAFLLGWHKIPDAVAGDQEARGLMLLASCMAGMAFNAAGLGVCHSLAHSLGGRVHIPHGRLNAMLLPHVIKFNSSNHTACRKYGYLAQRCGKAGTVRALVSGIERLRTALGMPDRLNESPDCAEIADMALTDLCTADNPQVPTAAELEILLQGVLP